MWIFINLPLGSVWMELILLKLKTEDWKHCSKIIFKYVNSAMEPIFNEKVAEKWYFWVCEQCTDALFTVEKSTFIATVREQQLQTTWNACQKKKKKKGKTRMWNVNVDPNLSLDYIIFVNFSCLQNFKVIKN